MESPEDFKRFSFGVTLLAAGASTRMGRPKMLLPWGNTSVTGHLIGQWKKLGAAQIAVVCSAGDQGMATELERLRFASEHQILNSVTERGMFSSIQGAARWPGWNRNLTHWILALGDQPHLQEKTLRSLLAFAAAHPQQICVPLHGGHRRHPVVLPAAAFQRLQTSTAQDLKQFLDSESPARCEVDDPGLDLDRPEDYECALQLRPQ